MFERHLVTNDYITIPISGNLYKINIKGEIKTSDEIVIETTSDTEGNKVAWLYLWEGWKFYKVAILLAHTFKPVHVPFCLWNKLDILFVDGDRTNIHPSNLVWKFPVGLESNKYPGYAFIPGYSRYLINKEGVVRQHFTGREIAFSKNTQGYIRVSLLPDIGKQTGIGRHRLLCLAWKDYPANVDKMHVNHKNGIPGSDSLDNLEWITPKGNIYHALRTGLKPDGKEILVRHLESGVVSSYYTEAQANEALGFSRGTIRRVTNIPLDNRKPYKGYDIRLARERIYWENINLDTHKDVLDSSKGKIGKEDLYSKGLRTDARAILVRNVLTNEIVSYYSLAECARKLSIGIPTIHSYVELKNQPILPGYLQFKDDNNSVPWRHTTNEEIKQLEKDLESSIFLRNVKTNEIIEFSNIIKCSEFLNLNYHQLYYYIQQPNLPIIPDYYQVQKKNELSDWRDPIDLEEENLIAKYGRSILMRNIKTNEVKEYNSARECSLDLGYCELTIAVRLRDKKQKVYEGGWQFKRKYDPTPWREVKDISEELKHSHYSIPVRVRDIFTKQEWKFDSIAETTERLNIPCHTLIDRKDNNTFPYFRYELRFDDSDWKDYSEEDLQMFKLAIEDNRPFRGRGFRLVNIETKEVRLFVRRDLIAKEFGITKAFISYLAQSNKIFRKKWRLSYYFN